MSCEIAFYVLAISGKGFTSGFFCHLFVFLRLSSFLHVVFRFFTLSPCILYQVHFDIRNLQTLSFVAYITKSSLLPSTVSIASHSKFQRSCCQPSYMILSSAGQPVSPESTTSCALQTTHTLEILTAEPSSCRTDSVIIALKINASVAPHE